MCNVFNIKHYSFLKMTRMVCIPTDEIHKSHSFSLGKEHFFDLVWDRFQNFRQYF